MLDLKETSTYNVPGKTLAPLTNEYGIMIIGVVGNARYGCACDDPIVSGDFDFSSGVLRPLFETNAFATVFDAFCLREK